MHIRLTNTDMEHVEVVRKHFSQLKPIPIDVATADVVRVGLRELVAKLGHDWHLRETIGMPLMPLRDHRLRNSSNRRSLRLNEHGCRTV